MRQHAPLVRRVGRPSLCSPFFVPKKASSRSQCPPEGHRPLAFRCLPPCVASAPVAWAAKCEHRAINALYPLLSRSGRFACCNVGRRASLCSNVANIKVVCIGPTGQINVATRDHGLDNFANVRTASLRALTQCGCLCRHVSYSHNRPDDVLSGRLPCKSACKLWFRPRATSQRA
ncbi:hypothetical protein SAMN05414139_10880 [Burkholderia sp. D7]|nr:hypothetical protein SAMN05414139_10880 [Burkholderia sp. D7]